MPNAVDETSAVTATVFAKTFQPDPPRAIISEEPACDSEPRCHETQTELAHANRVAILGQLSASIAEINQPISAVVMNAEAALRLLLAQPTDTEAVRRLLACIVKDGMRTGDIVNRTRADGSMIVVLEKGQCDSHKIEIKISARVSISIFHATTFPVNGARRGCHVPVMGGDRAIGGHTPTNRHSFIAGARSADNFRARAPVGRALGCSVEGGRTSRREP
jgi:hypothetical protein